QRDHEKRRIEGSGAVELDEGIALGAEALPADLLMDGGAQRAPAFDRPCQTEPLDGFDCSVRGNPGHDFGMSEVAARAAYLPDPLIHLPPCRLEKVEQRLLDAPGIIVRLDAVSACDMEGVGDLAINIQLKLRMRRIADANRTAALIAGEPRDLALGELALSCESVHDLQLS